MIVLVGFMGAGKTTVGRLLAANLGIPFTDSDHVIEGRAGKPVPRIFSDDGEPAFRQLEHEVIADLLNGEDMVLALGGGAATGIIAGFGFQSYVLALRAIAALIAGHEAPGPLTVRPMPETHAAVTDTSERGAR